MVQRQTVPPELLGLVLSKICNHVLLTVLLFILVTIFPDYTTKIKCNSLFILFPHPWSDAARLCRALVSWGHSPFGLVLKLLCPLLLGILHGEVHIPGGGEVELAALCPVEVDGVPIGLAAVLWAEGAHGSWGLYSVHTLSDLSVELHFIWGLTDALN